MSSDRKDKYSPQAIAHNQREFNKFKSLLAVVGGILSGIFGFSGLPGFLIFLPYSLVGTCLFVARLGTSVTSYYSSPGQLIFKSLASGYMVYMLTWIVFYNCIYILA